MKQLTISTPHITLIVLDYGAIIQKLLVKDANGNSKNVVIGHDVASNYLSDNFYLGAVVGRYAGRINNGTFVLDRQTTHLPQEDGVHLHGGKKGFGKRYWKFEEVNHGNEPFIRLSYLSPHLEEGYPGSLKVFVTYTLKHNQLHINYEATTDRTTVVNLTNHSYFNLDNATDLSNHQLQLNCSNYLETNQKLIPTGKIISVDNTNKDLRKPRFLGDVLYDTPFIIDPNKKLVAQLNSSKSGITMDVHTDQPMVVVYTPPHMPAICLETQNYPDAPNQDSFPSSVLKPNEKYTHATEYRFDIV